MHSLTDLRQHVKLKCSHLLGGYGMHNHHLILLLPFFLGSILSSAHIQIPGIAEITSPQEQETLTGSVTIRGTAAHPSFLEYDLAFGYSDDATGTWFPIGEAVGNPVQDGRLAVWDTTTITDGEYRLRLRVKTELGEPLSTILQGLRISNYSQTATHPPPAPDPGLVSTREPADEATPTPPPPAPSLPSRGLSLGRAFTTGSIVGILFLVGATFYIRLRADLRTRLGALKTRRFHRRLDRDRDRDSS